MMATNVANASEIFRLRRVTVLDPVALLCTVLADSRHLKRTKIKDREFYDFHATNLLIVVLAKLHQLLALVVFDAVEHRVYLPRFVLRLVVLVAQRAAVHANQFDDAESDKDLSDNLEQQSQQQEAERTNRAGQKTVHLDMVKDDWIDEQSGDEKEKIVRKACVTVNVQQQQVCNPRLLSYRMFSQQQSITFLDEHGSGSRRQKEKIC